LELAFKESANGTKDMGVTPMEVSASRLGQQHGVRGKSLSDFRNLGNKPKVSKPKTKNQMKTYTLIDSLNNREISRHKSVLNAVRAQYNHAAALSKSEDGYVWYRILDSDGKEVNEHELTFAQFQVEEQAIK